MPSVSSTLVRAALITLLLAWAGTSGAQEILRNPPILAGPALKPLGPLVHLDLMFMRLNKPLLDDKEWLKYFVAINLCGGTVSGLQIFNNEFEYPAIAAFYKTKASAILDSLSDSLSFGLSESYNLGEYDMTRKAFPFVGFLGQGKNHVVLSRIDLSTTEAIARRGRGLSCGTGRAAWTYSFYFRDSYSVVFREVRFAELPVSEAAAKKYVAQVQGERAVSVVVDLGILRRAPVVTMNQATRLNNIEFSGEIRRLTVVGRGVGSPVVGTLVSLAE